MNFLFAHQNFPGQYLHLARHLAAAGHRVVFVTQREEGEIPGVQKVLYKPTRGYTPNMHHYLRETELGVLNAQQVARAALQLRQGGFKPDAMLGHNAWGEPWYLRDMFPGSPLVSYFEFYYRAGEADHGFDPEQQLALDDGPRIRTRNLGNLLGLESCDLGQCPTEWQRSRFPEQYQAKIRVAHEGIDTKRFAPDPGARVELPGGGSVGAGDEVVTYVSRGLEAYRGFPTFMRSLPAILSRRPNARVIVVGADANFYGAPPAAGGTYREILAKELGNSVDWGRVHFLGQVPYPVFTKVVQLSRAHVYLTYPFVLSWSMLEAMAAGCLVVGSRTAPVEEVIRDGENGLLVDFFSPAQVAEGVVRALENAPDIARMRENARRTIVERYDLNDACLPRQLALVEEALGRRLAAP
jgi:glycosyltransferase involved in cell wall biosynthesis